MGGRHAATTQGFSGMTDARMVRREFFSPTSADQCCAAAMDIADTLSDPLTLLRRFTMTKQPVKLVGDYLGRKRARAAIEREVEDIGGTYGAILHRNGTPLLQAMQAFTFFRRSLDETAKQLSARHQLDQEAAARAREEIAALADRVLVGLASAYDN